MMSLKCLGILLVIQVIGLSEALFENCDFTYNLNPNGPASLLSPNYGNKYPPGTSCRYKVVAPLDYEILVDCNINFDKAQNGCKTEYFYISREGDTSLDGAEQLCGTGIISRTTLFRNLVVAYISGAAPGSTTGGKFNCTLTTRPQACDCGWTVNTRIVGGQNAALGEFPSTVGLYHIPSQQVFCDGSIIAHRGVVTAAHCTKQFPNASEVLIIAGDYDLSSSTESKYATSYPVAGYIENTGYNPTNNVNDIALVIPSTNIEWSRGVGPICLPLDQLSNTFDYTSVNLVGWGTTSFAGVRPSILQKVAVNILSNTDCQTVYPSLESTQVCTYLPNKDACQFDSGGPVIYKGSIREFLLGIISFGYACGTNPGVNTRMTSFISWIQNYNIGTICPKPYN